MLNMETFLIVTLMFLFLSFALLAVFLVKDRLRLFLGVLASVFIVASVNLVLLVAGTPRPASFEDIFAVEQYRVINFVIKDGDGIYMWLLPKDKTVPVYVKFPYTENSVRILREAMRGARKNNLPLVMKRKEGLQKNYETSLERFDIKYGLDFPEKLPEKQVEEIEPIEIR